jgi:Ubiquitin family
MFDLHLEKTGEIKIKETDKVSKLKEEYYIMNNINKNKIKIRLFFGGSEMTDENEIFKYNVKNDYTIQVSRREL